MDVIDKIFTGIIAFLIILALATPPSFNSKSEKTFEEKMEEAYFDCVSKALVNRDAALLRACDEVLKVNEE